MTAITTTKAPAPSAEAPPQGVARTAVRSVSVAEAQSKYEAALAKGMGTLLARGHGRERASGELLGELAGGCAPNEEEVGSCLLLLRDGELRGGWLGLT